MPITPGNPWDPVVRRYREAAARAEGQADLLEAVPLPRRGGLDVRYGRELWITPVGDSLNEGWSLWINSTPSRFTMRLTHNEGFTVATTVAQARANPTDAPKKLDQLIETMWDRRGGDRTLSPRESWGEVLGRLRKYGPFQLSRANLLAALDDRWKARLEVYDNGRRFGIQRIGDKEGDSRGVWIAALADGYELQLAVEHPKEGTTILRTEHVDIGESILERLEGLLGQIDNPTSEVTAQEAFKRLLRDHVGPLLRREGYKGSNGSYRRQSGDYVVSLGFQKSKWSKKERVDYRVNASVRHPETVKAFNEANTGALEMNREWEQAPAGDWRSGFPGPESPHRAWVSLRPSDDLTAHTTTLLDELRLHVFPEIKRQIDLPLSPPTPLADRPLRPSREQLDAEALNRTNEILRQAGVTFE